MAQQTTRPTADPAADAGPKAWPRLAFMIIFVVLFGVAQYLLVVLAALQALWLAFAGRPNAQLTRFGASLAVWLGEVARFQTVNTERKPFPWADWPAPRP